MTGTEDTPYGSGGGRAVPPPPGWQQPPSPAPGWQPPPPPGWQGAPGQRGPGGWMPPAPVHKPGIIALRPLALGDLYDGAFRAIRHNPGATVGAAVLLSAVVMALPVLVTAVLTASGTAAIDATGDDDLASAVGAVAAFGSLGLAGILQGLGTVLVTGMVARVVGAAVLGRTLTLAQAWAELRGRRWRLVGLTVLLGLALTALAVAYVLAWVALVLVTSDLVVLLLFGLVSVPAFLALLAWFWVRVYLLPASVLSLEDVGILQAIARGRRLSLGHYWRLFGVSLLTVIIAQVVGSVVAFPLVLVGELSLLAVSEQYAVLVLVLSQAVSAVLTAAFVTPFVAAVTTLQYVDLRMRQEAFDVELLAAAGLPAR